MWLPTKYALKDTKTGRETILIIPGAQSMDGSQLREIIQWQQEKFAKEAAQPKPKPRYPREEVKGALREYLNWRRRRDGQ